MKVEIHFKTEQRLIIDVTELSDYKENETLSEFKERVIEKLKTYIKIYENKPNSPIS